MRRCSSSFLEGSTVVDTVAFDPTAMASCPHSVGYPGPVLQLNTPENFWGDVEFPLSCCGEDGDCPSDGIPCTDEVCNMAEATCDYVPIHAVCDNGLYCDGDELCDVALGCQVGAEPCPGEACLEESETCVDPEGLWVDDVAILEGDPGDDVVARFVVSLAAPNASPVQVDYVTIRDSASNVTDYTTASGTLTFDPGEALEQFVDVPIHEDLVPETPQVESFRLVLSNPVNGTLLDNTGVCTITDDEDTDTASISDGAVVEGDPGDDVRCTFVVSIDGAITKPVNLHWSTFGGSASNLSDYKSTAGDLVFAPGGPVEQTVEVEIYENLVPEPTETFLVALTYPENTVIADQNGTCVITDDDGTSIAVDDVQVTEGDAGTQLMTFQVTRIKPGTTTASVDYVTADGTATVADGDYDTVSGTLTFAPADPDIQTVDVVIHGDLALEPDEVLFLELSNPSNATISDPQGEGTITNDDGQPLIAIAGDSAVEGAGSLSFDVTLTAASTLPVSVDFTTVPGTASADDDYLPTSGILEFEPGETLQTVVVTLVNDGLDEDDEHLQVVLADPVGAVAGSPGDLAAVGTIEDDDAPSRVAIDNASALESAGTMLLSVELSEPSGKQISIDYATEDGTATAGEDYDALTGGTLTSSPGEMQKSISVVLGDDPIDESDETLFVNLSGPVNATIADGQGVGTIEDDDGPPTVGAGTAAVVEGDTGSTTLTFDVWLSNPASSTVTVDYLTVDGTAVAGADYDATSGTLTFPPGGATVLPVDVVVVGDVTYEADEVLFLDLANPSNATLSGDRGEGTITDDDPQPALSIAGASAGEATGSLSFDVTLSAASAFPVSVDYATVSLSDGADAGDDYLSTSGSLGFAPGETLQTVVVALVDDALDEDDEELEVSLSDPVGGVAGSPTAVGIIVDDDEAPTLSIDSPSTVESAGRALFTISLSAPSGRPIRVDYATQDGTATAGEDYDVPAGGTLVISPPDTQGFVQVDLHDDPIDESDETFFVDLSDPVNATIDEGQGVATLLDDDDPPALSIGDATVDEGDSGTAPVSFEVSLSHPSSAPVTVQYGTVDGTAEATDRDYTAITSTLTFEPGDTTATLVVQVRGDTEVEDVERFFVDLSEPVGATLGDARGACTIEDDDIPVGGCHFLDRR